MKVLWFAVSILGALSYDRYADGNDDHYDVKDDHSDRNVDHYDAKDDHYDGPYVDRSDWYHVEYEERQMMEWFGLDRRDLDQMVVSRMEGEVMVYEWNREFRELLEKKVLPEICDLKTDNCTLYNSYLLDCNCVDKFEQISEKCRGMKCNGLRHFIKHGPRFFMDFLKAETIRDAVEVAHRGLKLLFDNIDMCKCGKEFIKALFKCAKYYNGNLARVNMDCYDLSKLQTILRNIDLESMGMFVDTLLGGMCEKSRKNKSEICLDSVFAVLKKVAEMVGGTMNDYSAYKDGTARERREYEERCDRLFGPLKAFHDVDVEHLDWWKFDITEGVEWIDFFNQSSAFMDNLYCKRPCKRDREALNSCCLKRLLSDKSIHALIEKAIISGVRLPSVQSYWWKDWSELDVNFKEILEESKRFSIPEEVKDAFRRTVQPAKYCSGRTLKCFN